MPKHEVEKGPISERNKLEHGLELLQHSVERAVPFHSFQEYLKNLFHQNFGDLYPNACQYKTRNGNSPCSIWLEYVRISISIYIETDVCSMKSPVGQCPRLMIASLALSSVQLGAIDAPSGVSGAWRAAAPRSPGARARKTSWPSP